VANSWAAPGGVAKQDEVTVDEKQKCLECGGRAFLLLTPMAKNVFRSECMGCGSTMYVEKPAK
jgi:ribosomal protein S27AE